MQTAVAGTSKKQVFSEQTAFEIFVLPSFSKTMVISDPTDVQRFLSKIYCLFLRRFANEFLGSANQG